MKSLVPTEDLDRNIFLIRGHKVMLDRHLAGLYGVQTGALNRAVKRNAIRFPPDFMFQLTAQEWESLKCRIGTSSWGGDRRALPRVFMEQGVAMLSSVLRSKRAALVNIAIMRAFVRLREMLATNKELAHKMAEMERKLENHDEHIQSLFQAIRQLMEPPVKPKPQIGFYPHK